MPCAHGQAFRPLASTTTILRVPPARAAAWTSSLRRLRVSMCAVQDTSFARLVSLACHDLRTPLATVHGFARTISRTGDLQEPQSRYVEMIEAASGQLAELLEELSLA